MVQLHKFLVAVSGVSVNHDGRGANALDPMVLMLGFTLVSLRFWGVLAFCTVLGLGFVVVRLLRWIFWFGRRVLAFCASLAFFLVLFIGHVGWLILAIMEFLTWNL